MSMKLRANGTRGYFSKDETERRYTLLKEHMAELNLDGVILIGTVAGPNFQEEYYFLQSDYIPSGYSATFVSRQGDRVALSHYLQARHHAKHGTADEVVAMEETENPAQGIADVLRDKGVTRGRVGWRWSSVPATWFQLLTEELPDIEWVDIASTFTDIWYVKGPEEAQASIRSAEMADAGFQHLLSAVRPGMTEYDVAAEFENFTVHLGANRNFTLISSGKYENGRGFPELGAPSMRVLEPGDSVMLEMTPASSGYYTQLVRAFQVGGTPDPKMVEVRQVAIDAIGAATSILRPGVTIGEVARALIKSVENSGYQAHFPIGHTVGVDIVYHRLLPDLDRVLHEDDTLIVHPKVHHPDGDYGTFWGETYLLTSNGNRKLHQASSDVEIAR